MHHLVGIGNNRQFRPRGAAFTIVEILVVMSVIIILLSLVIVATRAATRSAQNASTRTLMNSIKQALIRFEGDIGYLPPLLGDSAPPIDVDVTNHGLRKLFDPRGDDLVWNTGIDDITPQRPDGTPNPGYVQNVQDWYSVTSLAEYLIGYGGHNHDGYGRTTSGAHPLEVPPVGIRNPDADGVWGATLYFGGFDPGSLRARMNYPPPSGGMQSNVDIGRVYGPYLELKDDRLLAAVNVDASGELIVSFPGDGNFDPLLPRAIVDYWGNPIRFYRRMYAPGSLNAQYYPVSDGSNTPVHTPTLSDVFVLRPYEIGEGRVIDGLPDFSTGGGTGDSTTSMALQSAAFALLSPGPDRKVNPQMRVDDPNDPGNTLETSFVNEDNIVEIGP